MQQIDVLNKVMLSVRNFHANDTAGHDWWHVYRVWRMALRIAEIEGANLLLVQLAALLHDTDDWKSSNANATEDVYSNARRIMQEHGIRIEIQNRVLEIIGEVSFKGALVNTTPRSLEACIVQDADRLDAMGAIGVARAFAYGGSKNRPLYDPEVKPQLHGTFHEYKNSRGSTINHFFEKLLLLNGMLNTKTALKLGMERHAFLVQYVEQFMNEWNGNE